MSFFINTFTMSDTNSIIFLADISGSMGSPSTNNEEGREYSRLDFVKQSLIFAINALNDNTLFGLVTFESNGHIDIIPTKINANNKENLITTIKNLQTRGGTNIMSGLIKCKELYDSIETPNKNIIMLSDGEDFKLNVNNCDVMMNECFGMESNIKIDTVGYGPDANTQLLVKLASGTYALCYDASMVGTIIGRSIVRTYAGQDVYGINIDNDDTTNEYHYFRQELATILLSLQQFRQQNLDALITFGNKLYTYLNDNIANGSNKYYEFLIFMHGDVVGELQLGASDDMAWHKWGKAYWTTMGIALKNQYAPNFKDKSLQCFGTDNVKKEYERLSSIYNDLQMVEPSLHRGSGPVAIRYGATYNDIDGACLHSSSTLVLKDGNTVTYRDIEKMLLNDEEVWVQGYHNGDIQNVKIHNLIITSYEEKEFYNVDGCILTANHPILHKNIWTHPQKIPNLEMIVCKDDYVFNIILSNDNGERGQSVLVNGKPCVCFGHNIVDGSDAEDPFWGTEKVVECFYKAYGDRPVIETTMINVRSVETGFTIDLLFE